MGNIWLVGIMELIQAPVLSIFFSISKKGDHNKTGVGGVGEGVFVEKLI